MFSLKISLLSGFCALQDAALTTLNGIFIKHRLVFTKKVGAAILAIPTCLY